MILLLFAVSFTAGCVSTASDEATSTPIPTLTNTPTLVPTQASTPVVTSTPTPTKTVTPTPVVTSTPTPTKTITSTTLYYVNKESGIVHKAGCSYIKDLSNYYTVTDPSGYQKCSRCW